MAYTFSSRSGGKWKIAGEPDRVELAKSAMEKAKRKDVTFLIPSDNCDRESCADWEAEQKKGQAGFGLQNRA